MGPRRQRRPRSRRASRALHTFFVNKWYFDEAIDFLIVRPVAWLGRFANSTFERVFVNGALVGGATGAVRVAVGRGARHPVGLPALLRRAAAGRPHRPERLLPDLRMTIHLTILVFFPLVLRAAGRVRRRAASACIVLIGTLDPARLRGDAGRRLRHRRAGLQHVTDDAWIPELGIRYKLGVDGLNLWLDRC